MTDTKDMTKNIILAAFEKWYDKKWFQVLIVAVIVYLFAAPIAGPLIYQYINKTNTSEAVVESLDERDKQMKETHKIEFELAKQTYASVKSIMNEYLDATSAEYIFLCEYHNGMENVMSGIQFCHFDMTVEVLRDGLPYIPNDKFRNEYVARYDILLDPDFETSSKAFYFKTEDLKRVDRYLLHCMNYRECKSCVLINISNESDIIIGTMLFASHDEYINLMEVYKCQRDVEHIFKRGHFEVEEE